MPHALTTTWSLLKETAIECFADNTPRLGAAIAYYTIFSLGPLLVIVVAVAGLIFGQDVVRGELSGELRTLLGSTGGAAVEAMLADASRPREGIVATLLGIALLFIGVFAVTSELKDALNIVWNVPSQPERGVWWYARAYLLSAAGVLALGFLLIVSLVATAAVSAAGEAFLPGEGVWLLVLNVMLSFAIGTVLFALMFRWLPDAMIAWSDIWVGAAVTAALFEVGKLLIGVYLGSRGLESTYGAAASIVILLMWTFYSAQIVLIGAEFTQVYARRLGSLACLAKTAPATAAPARHDAPIA
jgi:membrane protein